MKENKNKSIYNMRKIGIVAVTNHNFGSILQTFALQSIIQEKGYSTEILKYIEPYATKMNRIKNKEYVITKLKVLYRNLVMSFFHKKQKSHLIERKSAFDKFIKQNIYFSKVCYSQKELTQISNTYETIILGSDQVWHPMNLHMDFFTLNFVPEKINKVAYAPSFGVSFIPLNYQIKYKKYIQRFQHLSSREETGVKLIESLTGRNAQWVCDPTLLLKEKDWLPYISDRIKYTEKYIFCYFIGNNPKQREIIKLFAKNNGYKIVSLLHIDEYIDSDENYADYTPYNVGPSEFLYLLKNSEFVMTDSFHATVFSLLFHKKFYTFNRFENGKGKSTTTRIDSLLKIVNLENNKINSTQNIENLPQIPNINYHEIDNRLEAYRQRSVQYLEKALNL